MLVNTKTEIIYYTIPTDFELEFNICGCCPMRLLTETADDINSLLSTLSRAFARNRVVMVTGPMNTGALEAIAEAIGYSTVSTDSEEYYHTESHLSALIENSVPLITEDGILGGCITESGEQALILLTSEKSVQRELMKKLIEPYIGAINKLENSGVTDEAEDSAEELPTDEVFEEPELKDEEVTQKEPEIEYLDDIIDDVFEDKKTERNGLNFATLIILILLLITVAALAYTLILVPLMNGTPILENLNNIINSLLG